MRLAVVGAGYWGANLVRVFQRLGVLDRICESNPRRIAEVAAIYRDIRVERSYEALLGDSSIDGVVIATPAETHYALAKEALRAGKDVFVEKPMTLQSTETEELTAMAEGFGRILMVGHLLEFHPAILRLQQLIEEGYLGRIEYIYSNRLNLGKVRREENALWSFAPHDISVILFLLNELPMQVTATGGTLITDNAGIDLNPATGTIQFTYAGIAQFNITGMNTASLSPTAVMSATLNGVLTSAVSFTVAISDNGFHIPNPPVFIAQDVGGTSCHADCGNGVTGTLAAQGFFGANNVNFNTGGTSTGVATTTLNEGTQSARSGTIFSGSPYSLTEFVTVTLTPGTTTNEFAQINADLSVVQVPEPASMLLLGGVLFLTAGSLRRRFRRA